MLQLRRVRPEHAAALLAFELENRAYFAASIPDRGDDYFTKSRPSGLATTAVHLVCALARSDYGLTALRSRATLANPGSRTVLARTGFLPVSEILLNGRPGLSYLRNLSEVA